ncbi:MAG TPA: protein translocase subunit SecD [Candidatus Pacearchaeota archaeon]|nr:protein translocase subunit SecD [Candidatus Pacearchaeota archaeon]HPR79708.1 protein translocase subunit SecD [Candidatus Pacearchaeota archaeon]
MNNKNIVISLISILALALVAGIFCYPNGYNQLVDNINSKYNLKIWHFPQTEFKLGLDLKGGVHLEYQADLSQIGDQDKSAVMEGLRDVIERRVNIFGVTEPIVQVYGTDRIAVDLPGVESVDDAIAWIGETPLLEFWEQRPQADIDKINAKIAEIKGLTTLEEIQKVADWQVAFENPYQKTELTGKYLKKATLNFDQTTYAPIIQLKFDDAGAKLFEAITERNVGKTLAITLDGASIVDTNGDGKIDSSDLYAPRVENKISGGEAIITGQTDIKAAKTLVQRLNQGALPVPLGSPIVQKKIGPTLGEISLNKSVQAGIYSIIGIIIFLILFYRLPGLIASVALIVYCLIILALIKLIPVTLTLAGIGGLILSIGMAVDANILIFSRMKEELKAGKDVMSSIVEGCNRAWPSIRDGHFTALIVMIILYFLGTSFIKAFAFALILGLLLNLFSSMVVSRIFLEFVALGKVGKIKLLWK